MRGHFLRHVLFASLLLASTGCSTVLRASGHPPEATRTTSPTELEQNALEVGADAPEWTASGSVPAGSLAEARKDGAVVLLFYRGDG